MVAMKTLRLAALLACIAAPATAQTCGTVTTCPNISTPLSGTELFYAVQAGVSKKITFNQFIASIPSLGGGAPGGSNTQLQYNNNGLFGGISGATTNGTTVTLASPILTTPNLGTPSVVVLTHGTALPPIAGLAASGSPSSSTYLRGDGSWASLPANANLIFPATDNASGSNTTTTGSVAGSTRLTLTTAIDFANLQGIRINNAGPNPTIGAVSSPTAVATCTGGCTTNYKYAFASLDNKCGMKAVVFSGTVSNRVINNNPGVDPNTNAYMGYYNYNSLAWTPGAGSIATAIYRSTDGGSNYAFAAVSNNTSWVDGGFDLGYVPDCIPAAANGSDQPQWLVTYITAGGGTTTLTLAAAATQTASGLAVAHDDTVAINTAITYASSLANGSVVYLPCGTYNITAQLSITSSNVGVVGPAACSFIAPFGPINGFYISGVSPSVQISNNVLTNVSFPGYGTWGGGTTVFAQNYFNLTTDNVTIYNPWAGATFKNANSLNMTNWRIERFWGNNTVGIALISDATNYFCCDVLTNVSVIGLSKQSGFSDIQNDKIGIRIDGNSATHQWRAVTSIEIAGTAIRFSNDAGHATPPQFLNAVDTEIEFANGRSVDIAAGQDINMSMSQIHGARDNNVVISSGVKRVNFNGGFISGAKCDGAYVQGTLISFTGMNIYDNSAPPAGGTSGACYGIEWVSGSSGFSTSAVNFDGANRWQAYGMLVNAAGDHFNLSGIATVGGNQNAGINNLAGTGVSKVVSIAQ